MTRPEEPPGSEIDFGAVGCLHLVDRDSIAPTDRIADAERGIRECEVRLEHTAQAGDIIAMLDRSALVVHIGPPLQVRAIDGTTAVAHLDERFDVPGIEISGEFGASLGRGDMLAAWEVLHLWGVDRCPRCHAPGRPIMHGMPPGPQPEWIVEAGCMVTHLMADMRCLDCSAEWRLPQRPSEPVGW